MLDSASAKDNTSLHGEVSSLPHGPHVFSARRSDAAGCAAAAEEGTRAFGERAGPAAFAKASGNDEASGCPVRCGIDHTRENRSHGVGPSFGPADAGGHG